MREGKLNPATKIGTRRQDREELFAHLSSGKSNPVDGNTVHSISVVGCDASTFHTKPPSPSPDQGTLPLPLMPMMPPVLEDDETPACVMLELYDRTTFPSTKSG